MTLIERLLDILGLKPSLRISFELDDRVAQDLRLLAREEQRPAEDIAADLLAYALDRRRVTKKYLDKWNLLSYREQQVVAYICLNHTSAEIGRFLNITTETVKSHARNALNKFDLRLRTELRHALADWDFHAWLRYHEEPR